MCCIDLVTTRHACGLTSGPLNSKSGSKNGDINACHFAPTSAFILLSAGSAACRAACNARTDFLVQCQRRSQSIGKKKTLPQLTTHLRHVHLQVKEEQTVGAHKDVVVADAADSNAVLKLGPHLAVPLLVAFHQLRIGAALQHSALPHQPGRGSPAPTCIALVIVPRRHRREGR
eukprot:SAG11_NODE_1480_length_4835_cov_3.840794_6_plen_174_part_00